MKSLNVKNLITACKNVSDWRPLGIQLDLNPAQLDDIYRTFHTEGVPGLKIHVFVAWLKNSPGASWTDLVNALKEINENRVASDIERDYIHALPIKGTITLIDIIIVSIYTTVLDPVNTEQNPDPLNTEQNPDPLNTEQNPDPVNTEQNPDPLNTEQNPDPLNTEQNPDPLNTEQNPDPLNTEQNPDPLNTEQNPDPLNTEQNPDPLNTEQNPTAPATCWRQMKVLLRRFLRNYYCETLTTIIVAVFAICVLFLY